MALSLEVPLGNREAEAMLAKSKMQKDKAVATQTKAVKLADDSSKEQFQASLDSYKAGKLPKSE